MVVGSQKQIWLLNWWFLWKILLNLYLSIIILIKQYNDEGRPPHNLINVISYTCFMEILMGFQVPLLFLKNAEYHDLYKIGFK